MKEFTVSLFGHRRIDNTFILEKQLWDFVSELLKREEYVEFLIGRDGDFDLLAASVIRRCQKHIRADNSALVLVLPYKRAEIGSLASYYDEVMLCPLAETAHFKAAHQLRNRYMLERSDFALFYVEHQKGGAWQSLCYAQKLGIPLLMLGDKCDI